MSRPQDALTNREDQIALIEENQELKRALKSKTETYFEKGVFWGKDGSGPFCPKCIQQSPFNQIYITNNDPQEKESWKCPVCNGSHISQEALQRVSFHANNARFISCGLVTNMPGGH